MFYLNVAIPNVILDGPFLTLKEGELVKCFEAERIDDAISSMEHLFAAPIHPIDPETALLSKPETIFAFLCHLVMVDHT